MNNTALFLQIFNLHGHFFLLDKLMVFGAEVLAYLVIVLMVVLTIIGKTKERKTVLLAVLSLILSWIIVEVIRLFSFEPRPFVTYHFIPLIKHSPDASFPSTHATRMACIALSFYFYKSKYAPLMFIILFWMGFARIFVGVHYPLDILGGFLVGIISVILAVAIKKLLMTRLFR